MATKEQTLKKLIEKYDRQRDLRNDYIDNIKKIRLELARRTFADLDSRKKNPFYQNIRAREKRMTKRYYYLDNSLDKLNNKIEEARRKGR